MIEMQRFDRIVRANSMARCFCAEPRALGRFVGQITAMAIGGFDERVVLGLRDDVIEVGHGMKEERTLGAGSHAGITVRMTEETGRVYLVFVTSGLALSISVWYNALK